jgi:hypothetical protein
VIIDVNSGVFFTLYVVVLSVKPGMTLTDFPVAEETPAEFTLFTVSVYIFPFVNGDTTHDGAVVVQSVVPDDDITLYLAAPLDVLH